MNKKPSNKSREVYFKITLDVGMNIPSASLEEALEKGRKLQAHDIVDVSKLSYNDSEIEITGVYEI